MYPHLICRWTILRHDLKGSSKGRMRLINFAHFDNVSWSRYFFLPCPLPLFLIVVVQSLSYVRFLATHGRQHTRPLCPLLSPRVCSNSCPWSRWCYLTISSSTVPFYFAFNFSHHQDLFQWVALLIRWPKYWGFIFCITPSSKYSGLTSFRTDWFDLLAVQGLPRVSSNTTVQKHQFFGTQPSS